MLGGRIWKGKRGRAVGAGMVQAGLGGFNTTIALERGTQPFHQIDRQSYIKPIQHMLAGFNFFDPATEKKLACHPDLPDFAREHAYKGKSTAQHATGDLIVIAFYFLLRIGEYTAGTKRKKKTRRRQFREKDVTFFKQKKGMLTALPRDTPAEEIMMADAATLRISNKKNGHAGASVHHWALTNEPNKCPVRALGRRVAHIRRHATNGNALLCAFWDQMGRGDVTGGMVRFSVKYAAAVLDYPVRGILIDRIDTHSLHSGGACALSVAGFKPHEIMKMGRWAPNSLSFMEYIQQQLSTFSAGMSDAMSKIKPFTNMEGATNSDDLRAGTIH